MGKAKKGKNLGKEDETSDGEVEVKTSEEKLMDKKSAKNRAQGEDSDSEDQPKVKGKDKKKKGKKVAVSDDEASEEELKPTKKQVSKKKSKGSDSESEDNSDDVPKKSKSKKSKKVKDDSDSEEVSSKKSKKGKKSKAAESSDEDIGAVKSSFALLSVEDGDSDEEPAPQPPSDSEPEEVITKSKSKKGGKDTKQGKKKKKKKDEDDEDLDAMLADLALEYAGVKKEESNVVAVVEEVGKKKKKKGAKNEEEESSVAAKDEPESEGKAKADKQEANEEDEPAEAGGMKTAAQKKKERKERQKLKEKEAKADKKPAAQEEQKPEVADVDQDEAQVSDKKKKTKGKDVKEKEKEKEKDKDGEEKKTKKGPAKKTIAAMQEALKLLREQEEKAEREEEERIRRLEAADEAKREAARLEQERREKKKLKEKERKERLKAEGKLLTPKEKAARARAQEMLEARKAQGLDLPNVGEKKIIRPGTRVRPSKVKSQTSQETEDATQKVEDSPGTVQVEIVDKKGDKPEPKDDIKDSWDAESSEEEEEDKTDSKKESAEASRESKEEAKDDEESSDGESSDGESESESEEASSDSDDESEDDGKTDAEKKRQKAVARIQKRREDAEKNRTTDKLRAAVVCVLGHVDTGKTKILDKLRRTNVQDGEAGGITQQIGATNVPIEAIKEQVKIVKGFDENDLRIPGLLIIDTPGHESFSNLRNRGSSLCDIAILVVDIMHALEPQTIESLNLLKNKKTPFVVALNKIDRLYDWQTMNRKDVRDIIKAQQPNTQLEFEQRTKEVILQFAEQGLNAALFYENPDPRSYVSLVPTSAITGEGMGNLLSLIVDSCQNLLAKRLMYSDDLQATVLEVKEIRGLGTTIDCILVNGRLREGDTMIVAGTEGPIVTQIRSLLMPQPMKELRVKNQYVEYKEIQAAQGVKIAAKELEKAIAGLNLQVAQKPDEVEILKEEVARDLKSALSHVKLAERGVYVQASTLGSLEALLEFLKQSKIPYANIRIGPVVKRDVMKASTMLEHDSQFATILAFDVKVERDAQEMADTVGVKIFQADIIYHLFDKFMSYREELKQRKRDEFKHIAVFPCKLRVLPQFVFNSRDPIVCGVMVEAGIVREGTPICVPSKEFVEIGIVTSVEVNHKNVENARKGMEVCVKIEPVPGEAPKMFGRHFDETDMLVSKISRASIDACKDYFRDDLNKQDWQLMVELKKVFEIL